MSFKQILKENLPEPAIEVLKSIRDGMRGSKLGSVALMHAHNVLDGTANRFSIFDDSFHIRYDAFGKSLEVKYPYLKDVTPYQGSYETSSYLQVPGMINEGDIVIDAGAWPGDFTIVASSLVGRSGKVIALEPNSDSISYLRDVIQANDAKNVEALELGLYSSQTRLDFVKDSYGSRITDSADGKEMISIHTTTIDDILGNIPADKRVIVKMDIEGAEIEAVKGAVKSMTDKRRDLSFMIASYHLVDGVKSMHILEPMLAGYGFSVEHKYPRHLTTYAMKK